MHIDDINIRYEQCKDKTSVTCCLIHIPYAKSNYKITKLGS